MPEMQYSAMVQDQSSLSDMVEGWQASRVNAMIWIEAANRNQIIFHRRGYGMMIRRGNRKASHAVVMLHGRGATGYDILSLDIDDKNYNLVAPQAKSFQWYPRSFIAPLDENEPCLSDSLSIVYETIRQLGLPDENIVLLGFSQGACLCLEYAVRFPARYGALIALSGGLMGREPMTGEGSLSGTPVFLGCSSSDPFVPIERIDITEELLRQMGAYVTKFLYPGSSHAITEPELRIIRQILKDISG